MYIESTAMTPIGKSSLLFLSAFINLSENAKNAEVMIEKEDDEKEKVLEMSIDELELSGGTNDNALWTYSSNVD